MRHALTLPLMLAFAMSTALAAEPPPLVVSADGGEFVDAASGLAWSRCVEGMGWDGRRCTGQPRLATHAEALALARTRSSADGRLWRVPRVPELKRLSGRLANDHGAAALAPGAPAGWYWSSSARIESEAVNAYNYGNVQRGGTERQVDRLMVQQGWAVEQPGGAVRDLPKRQRLSVRLVRPLDPAVASPR